MYGNAEKIWADLLQSAGDPDTVPTSAIRDLRGKQSQQELARRSGMTHAQISRLESGDRNLTREVALKMAPALDVSADELMVAEEISSLQRQAANGELDPRRVLDLILELADRSEDSKAQSDALDALLTVAKKSLSTYQAEYRERLAARQAEEEEQQVSTKSARPQPRRDAFGRRLSKRNQPPKGT